MGAVGAHGVDLILHLCKEHLAAFDTFDFSFLLLTVLQVDASQALELVFGSHCP